MNIRGKEIDVHRLLCVKHVDKSTFIFQFENENAFQVEIECDTPRVLEFDLKEKQPCQKCHKDRVVKSEHSLITCEGDDQKRIWQLTVNGFYEIINKVEGWTLISQLLQDVKKRKGIFKLISPNGQLYEINKGQSVRFVNIHNNIIFYAPFNELKIMMTLVDKFGINEPLYFFELDLSKLIPEANSFISDIIYDDKNGIGYCLIFSSMGYRIVKFKRKSNKKFEYIAN